MARTLLRLSAWATATALAVTMSWFGVHQVLAADAFADTPTAIPIGGPRATSLPSFPPPTPSPLTPPSLTPAPLSPLAATAPPSGTTLSTARPALPTASATVAAPAARPPAAPAAAAPAAAAPPPAAAPTSDIQSYQLTGGRVVLEMAPTSARLVSATPEPGWQVQAWQAEGWLRVDFSREGAATSSCFVTWNGHPPTVQTT